MSLFSYLFLGIQFIVLPWLSFQSRDLIEGDKEAAMPSRQTLYIQSIIMLTVLGGLAALVDWREGLSVHWFGIISTRAILLAVAVYALGMILNVLNFKYFEKNNEFVTTDFILPQKANEYVAWILVCVTAAWSEEYIYRGVLTSLLAKNGMMYMLAVVLSAVAFSFSHYTQGSLAVLITFVFALGFQYLYHISDCLILPVIVHLIYNLSVEYLRRALIKTASHDQSPGG